MFYPKQQCYLVLQYSTVTDPITTTEHTQQLSVLVPFVASLIVGLCVFPSYIKWLKSKQVEQYLREEGPKSHAAKAKTPTMGGLGFIVAIFAGMIPTLVMSGQGVLSSLLILSVAGACAALGFADDFGKVTSKSNKGISGKLRLAVEFGLGAALALGLWFFSPESAKVILLPGAGGVMNTFALPLLGFIGASMFIMAATTNAINLHDGMDGLAGGTCFLAFATMAVILLVTGQFANAAIAAAAAGGLASFLVFNKNPAKVFMGDTGSLFLGGLMGALVMSGGLLLWFVPLSLIYIAETVSVMMQVSYFKLTKEFKPEKPMLPIMVAWHKLTHKLPGEGKRIFRMAPLHHHFEAVMAERNTGEASVVSMFWLAQAILCAAILSALFLGGAKLH